MSQQEQDAAAGRMAREYAEQRRLLVALEDEARRTGEMLHAIARVVAAGGMPQDLDAIDVARIRQVAKEIEETRTRMTNLRHQVRSCGFEVPD